MFRLSGELAYEYHAIQGDLQQLIYLFTRETDVNLDVSVFVCVLLNIFKDIEREIRLIRVEMCFGKRSCFVKSLCSCDPTRSCLFTVS